MAQFDKALGTVLNHKHSQADTEYISPATRVVAPAGSGLKADYYTDGTADDVQIQAALDAAEAAGGGTIYIKEGTYDITAALTAVSNIKIIGDGFSTILRYTDGATFSGIIKNDDQVSGNTGIIITHLAIDGNSANTTVSPPQDMIWLKNTVKCIVEDVYIFNAPDSAIVLDKSACKNNIVKNNIIDTTVDIGIYSSEALQNEVIGNIVLNTGSYGIRFVSASHENNCVGNWVYNCGQTASVDGIVLDNSQRCNCTGNYVYLSGRNGIRLTTATYANVSGNYVIQTDQHGIYVDGAFRGNVTGNTVHISGQATSNTYSGIYLNNAVDTSVIGNRSGDIGSGTRQKYGIEEAGTSDNNIIIGNMLDRNGTAAMVTVGASTMVLNNRSFTTNKINGTLSPLASDGGALGTTSLMWSDLFLASGGVINFNNGDVTLTHAADTLTIAGGTVVLPTTTAGGVITLSENSSIALDPAGSADGKYSGTTVAGTGGDTIAFGDLVTLDKDDSRWEKVDISVAAAATGDARGIIGIAATSSTDGAAITVLLNGIIRADANFPALTIGAAVYASTTGDIVVTQPTTTDHVIRIVGYALTADEIYFCPDNDWITHT